MIARSNCHDSRDYWFAPSVSGARYRRSRRWGRLQAIMLLTIAMVTAVSAVPAEAASKSPTPNPAGVSKSTTKTAVTKATVAPSAAAAGVSAYVTGDVFAGLSNGTIAQFDGNGTAKRSLSTGGTSYETGMCFDGAGNLYSTNFGTRNMTKFDNVGTQVSFPWAGTALDAASPESCVVDNHQHVYVGSVDSGSLKEFDVNGTLLKTFAPATEDRGLDWIDLSGDQCTMLYTSEGSGVKAFDVCTNTQLADFATNLPAPCFAIRILKDGRVAVACASEVVLLDKSGKATTTYTGASLRPPQVGMS